MTSTLSYAACISHVKVNLQQLVQCLIQRLAIISKREQLLVMNFEIPQQLLLFNLNWRITLSFAPDQLSCYICVQVIDVGILNFD